MDDSLEMGKSSIEEVQNAGPKVKMMLANFAL
jgi:hypothetical protein